MNHLKWNIGCFGKGEKRKVRNRTRFTNCSHNCALGSAHVRLILLLVFSFLLVCYRAAAAAAHQAPPSLGFSRQEHWSGLPFPSPVHESEKWKWSRSVSDSSRPHGLQPTRLLRPWDFSRQEYWSGVPLPSLMLQGSFLVFLLFPLQPDLPGRISCSIFSSPRSLGSFGGLCLGHGECS